MIIKTEQEQIAPFLNDASNFRGGRAGSVVIPDSVEELVAFLKKNTQPLTISGGGTGVVASRVPLSGTVVSLEKLNAMKLSENEMSVTLGPAVRLKQLQDSLENSSRFYPPNPTETLASVGGTLATNASGSRSYKWGATRNHVLSLNAVLVDGRSVHVTRDMTINSPLTMNDNSKIHFPEIAFRSLNSKNAAGYHVQTGMSWLDLLVGSDGTLVFITEVTLRLQPKPAGFIGGTLFFPEETMCWHAVEKIKKSDDISISPCSLEYFDKRSLLRLKKKFSRVPDFAKSALVFEQEFDSAEKKESLLETWFEFLDGMDVSLEHSWFAQNDKEHEFFADFRHQLPLMINEENNQLGRTKMGTDMAVNDEFFMDMMFFYRETLEHSGIDFVVFGHIGDNHLHINLLPKKSEIKKAQEVYQCLVDRILGWGGTISAEHGVGKIKKKFFHQMVGDASLSELKEIKRSFDPKGILGRGNLF